MGDRFDEFAKGLARGTSRREALRQLGFGLAGLGLAALGLSKPEEARAVVRPGGNYCAKVCGGSGPSCKSACDSCVNSGDSFCVSKTADKFSCCSPLQTCSATTGTCG